MPSAPQPRSATIMSEPALADPPDGLTLGQRGHSDPDAIAIADHKQAVTRMFRDTFNPYKPTIIDWPELSADELDRLVHLPICDIAVQTEGRARIRMLSFAKT